MHVTKKRIVMFTMISLLVTLNVQARPAFALTGCNEYIEVPSDSTLELTTFNIQIKFRLSDFNTSNRMYLVSKGNESANNSLLDDQNYAIYITRANKVAMVVKDVNDNYHYIYSKQSITDNDWHVVIAQFEYKKLTLILDGVEVENTIGKIRPDTDGNKPLRIGANSNTLNEGCLKGEIEHVTIKTKRDGEWIEVYTYEALNKNSCSALSFFEFTGVVFIDPILSSAENENRVSKETKAIVRSIEYLSAAGFTGIRVPFYWEAYVARPSEFTERLKLIAETAEENGLCIVWDNHHYYTTSAWELTKNGKPIKGRGFPSFLVNNYEVSGEYNLVAEPFWRDFLKNNITVNGKKVWDLQLEFLTNVVNIVEEYKSSKGLEILNEPHLWRREQYNDLANYYKHMATELRKITDMTLIIKRETMRSSEGRDPAQLYKLIPTTVSNVAFSPHLYSLPCDGCKGERQLNIFKQLANDLNIQIYIGEFAAKQQEHADIFLSKFKSYKFGWTEYRWSKYPPSEQGAHLYIINGEPTPHLMYLLRAYEKYY
ncbi:MAG: cellulase family glycosylhydrolase [Candidatus Nitrosocaldus sp.]|nr:cellulase family glycosylhydrolase [Candidatus Nitrosocaldus sp.]MDW8274793.1 cellulase family glycosylhydrolase [Candidatus Nitrosocaldus sp.]